MHSLSHKQADNEGNEWAEIEKQEEEGGDEKGKEESKHQSIYTHTSRTVAHRES